MGQRCGHDMFIRSTILVFFNLMTFHLYHVLCITHHLLHHLHYFFLSFHVFLLVCTFSVRQRRPWSVAA